MLNLGHEGGRNNDPCQCWRDRPEGHALHRAAPPPELKPLFLGGRGAHGRPAAAPATGSGPRPASIWRA